VIVGADENARDGTALGLFEGYIVGIEVGTTDGL